MYTPSNTTAPQPPNSAFAPNIPNLSGAGAAFSSPPAVSPVAVPMTVFNNHLKKPLLIEDLETTEPFAAAAWFHDHLSVAVNKAYRTDRMKNENLQTITNYLAGPARDK